MENILKILKKKRDTNDNDAINCLGFLFLHGLYVTKDREIAKRCFLMF